jgi:membrane fusion protein (multidrug efflux system)
MFGGVTIDIGAPQKPLTLPQTAITYNTYGSVVFVITRTTVDGKEVLAAQQRFVTTGETRGDQVVILSGVTAQDEVVSVGGNKLKNGSLVAINNKVTLPNDANPHPKDE